MTSCAACSTFAICSASSSSSRTAWRPRRVKAPLAATTSSTLHHPSIHPKNGVAPPIHCFLASHVSSEARCADLERLLKSILANTHPTPPPLSASWSSTPELAPRVRSIFNAASTAGLALVHLEQPNKTSQFEHLRALAAAHASHPPMWVMFTDDDDIWSERRFAIYWDQARIAAKAAPNAAALLCRRKCQLRGRASEPSDAPAVRRLVEQKRARFSDCMLPDGLGDDEHNMAEYFDRERIAATRTRGGESEAEHPACRRPTCCRRVLPSRRVLDVT